MMPAPYRTVYCQTHQALEEVADIHRIDKAGEEGARDIYGTSTEGCKLAFRSSLFWKKGPQ